MNKREALPKAAFQYGVKMTDGRKTRRIGVKTEKSERAELDREWQKIQSIIHKRKGGPSESYASICYMFPLILRLIFFLCFLIGVQKKWHVVKKRNRENAFCLSMC